MIEKILPVFLFLLIIPFVSADEVDDVASYLQGMNIPESARAL